ncbi:MAG: SAM-dependent methyltransferase [Clostridia bacterium]|nr:SAM-dependent methyltransferase [Clostridia bacterium]
MILTGEQRASADKFCEIVLRSAEAGTLRNVVLSAPSDGDLLKIKGVLRVIRGNRVLQVEKFYTEGRVAQENLPLEEIPAYVLSCFTAPFRRADLNDAAGSASLMMSQKGRVTAVIPGTLKNALSSSVSDSIRTSAVLFSGNNREKNRLLKGDEPFLIQLGISDKNGRVHDKKQSKFRQICRFSELVMEQIDRLPKEGTLYVADLCCGKSYLSFAVYHCLRYIANRDVEMVCMDLKKSVIDYCADTARALGYDGMQFICGDIADYRPSRAPDMVVSLHACDIATDIVLDFAAQWRAAVILSTPCCQRELSTKLECASLDFIASRPILRKKFCDAATDSLRLLRLECMGYTADALEFIDPEDTPKNIMLRAVRRSKYDPEAKAILQKREEYRTVYRFLTGEDPKPFAD